VGIRRRFIHLNLITAQQSKKYVLTFLKSKKPFNIILSVKLDLSLIPKCQRLRNIFQHFLQLFLNCLPNLKKNIYYLLIFF